MCLPRMSASSAWTPLPACSDVESRGRGWLLENMQLLGLDAEDKGRSLFTCVKELFENAVDACQNADAWQNAHPCFDEATHSHSIEVAVVPIDDRPDFYSVRIGDTGCGFGEERLAAVGALYSSSKAKGPRTSTSAGGLTLMEAGESDFAAASAGVFGVVRHVESAALAVPQLTTLASWGWASGLLAALRTRNPPLDRSGPTGRLRCGREVRPKSPIPAAFTTHPRSPRWG